MAEALLVKSGGGTDSGDLTATLSQVLSGYTAMTRDSNDDPGTGTMPNRGAVNQTLNAGGSYTIPQGYHNGNGKVAANSLSSQTSGNASSAQILTGYNAWVNGSNVNGAMPNRGNLNFNPSGSTSQAVPSGYYSGGTLSSANAYNAGYNAGYDATSIEGFLGTQYSLMDTKDPSISFSDYSGNIIVALELHFVYGVSGTPNVSISSSGWELIYKDTELNGGARSGGYEYMMVVKANIDSIANKTLNINVNGLSSSVRQYTAFVFRA